MYYLSTTVHILRTPDTEKRLYEVSIMANLNQNVQQETFYAYHPKSAAQTDVLCDIHKQIQKELAHGKSLHQSVLCLTMYTKL